MMFVVLSDHPGDQVLTVGKLDVFEDLPLVFVRPIGRHEHQACRLQPEKNMDDVVERDVMIAWCLTVARTHVNAHSFGRDVRNGSVEDLHPALDRLEVFRDGSPENR